MEVVAALLAFACFTFVAVSFNRTLRHALGRFL